MKISGISLLSQLVSLTVTSYPCSENINFIAAFAGHTSYVSYSEAHQWLFVCTVVLTAVSVNSFPLTPLDIHYS